MIYKNFIALNSQFFFRYKKFKCKVLFDKQLQQSTSSQPPENQQPMCIIVNLGLLYFITQHFRTCPQGKNKKLLSQKKLIN